MSWWRRPARPRRTREQIDEIVRILYQAARAPAGAIVELPGWMDQFDLIAFNDSLAHLREWEHLRRYQLQADGIYLTSN